MEKTLANMPQPVWQSAIAMSQRWPARLVVRAIDKAALFHGALAVFAWWTLAYWAIAGILPFDGIRSGIPAMQNFIVVCFALHVAVTLFLHYLQLLTFKPLAERGWPCISNGTAKAALAADFATDGFYFYGGIALPATAFGLALLASSYFLTHGAVSHYDHLYYGLASLGIGIAAFVLDRFTPSFFLRAPTDAEIDMVAAQHRVEHERRMQPRPSPGQSADQSQDYALPVEAKPSKTKFENIFGMQAVKDKLLEPSKAILADRAPGTDAPSNGILLHGEPGNGKTVFAEALAGELGIPMIQLTYGDVSSKWVGEMPRVIANVFAYAKRSAPCLLFLDELDSFITSRDSGSGNSEDLKITNTLLTEIVNLRDHKVVLMGATNYLANLDAAAIREGRFDFKIEITPPDEPARIGLIKQAASKHGQSLQFDQDAMASIAKRWTGFSVSRLLAVAKAIPGVMKERVSSTVGYDDWMAALRDVQGRNGKVPQNTKSLSEMILEKQTRDAIEMVAQRLKDVHKIETLGGTLPTGVLFYGPSGTGKTAAARALAKEAGWAFLAVAGPDLVADRKALQKIYTEAKDIRPTIIFIDEADDVLRDRQYSSTPDICNKLLVLMDGVDERVKDVVFIAATNNPEQIDPALLRTGRFTEKVEFSPPPAEELPRFIAGWLKAKKISLQPDIDVFEVASILQGQTIANVEGTLQYALNRAISLHTDRQRLELGRSHLEMAHRVVLSS